MSEQEELPWIWRSVTTDRVTMWRTPLGDHYEAKDPQSGNDEPVMQRTVSIVSGELAGGYPEYGPVHYESGQVPVTEATLPPVYSAWEKVERHAV